MAVRQEQDTDFDLAGNVVAQRSVVRDVTQQDARQYITDALRMSTDELRAAAVEVRVILETPGALSNSVLSDMMRTMASAVTLSAELLELANRLLVATSSPALAPEVLTDEVLAPYSYPLFSVLDAGIDLP